MCMYILKYVFMFLNLETANMGLDKYFWLEHEQLYLRFVRQLIFSLCNILNVSVSFASVRQVFFKIHYTPLYVVVFRKFDF